MPNSFENKQNYFNQLSFAQKCNRLLLGAACILMLYSVSGCGGTSTEAAASPKATPTKQTLQEKLDDVLTFTLERRSMDLNVNRAWQILHGVLAYGKDFEITNGDDKINVLDWVFDGNEMQGWTLTTTQGGLHAVLEQGSSSGQGHSDQWIAVIAQCGIPLSQPIKFRGKNYTVNDLVESAKRHSSEAKEEYSWTLIALSKYLKSFDETWEGRDGDTWSMEKMLQYEADTFRNEGWEGYIYNAACSGTHRLIGIQMAVNEYQRRYPKRALPIIWSTAKSRAALAVKGAKKYQLPSGAFSADFRRMLDPRDLAEHIGSTGHTLEFLTFALTKEELQEPWVTNAVGFLCDVLQETKTVDLESGGLYHAIHGLVLYRDKVFGPIEK